MSPPEDCCLLYVTTPNETEARALARLLVESRLAACANILNHMVSLYHWNGLLREDAEVIVILKTTTALADQAQAAILAQHSYACACVLRLPVSAGNPAFLDWIRRETTHPAPPAETP